MHFCEIILSGMRWVLAIRLSKIILIIEKIRCLVGQDTREKIEHTERFLLLLWTAFLIVLYACSFLTEYYFSGEQEETVAGKKILNDLQKLFFFALMGVGFLIDLVRMREDKNKAFVFLLLTLVIGGFSGGIGSLQFYFISIIMGGG